MGEPIYMRKATLDDLDAVYEIIENARQLLKEDGSDQWQKGYPSKLSMQQDIEADSCYLSIDVWTYDCRYWNFDAPR